jgi:N-hydroxyarylamine O-acetyltransferase
MIEGVWNSAVIDLDAYLHRIGFTARPRRDVATLHGLVRAHATAIPFENLDILLGRPISLDLGDIQDKLVTRRRGGYCFEQNFLLAAVLERLGFTPVGVAARVHHGDRLLPRTHMALAVEAEGERWLADVGFGNGRLTDAVPFTPHGPAHRLHHTDGAWTLRTRIADEWHRLYTFTLDPTLPIDFTVLNHYTSTHPRSPFTRRCYLHRTTATGSTTLDGTDLRHVDAAGETQHHTASATELPDLLRTTFDLDLPPTDIHLLTEAFPWPVRHP